MSGDTSTLQLLVLALAYVGSTSSVCILLDQSNSFAMKWISAVIVVLLSACAAECAYQLDANRRALAIALGPGRRAFAATLRSTERPKQFQELINNAKTTFSQNDADYVRHTFEAVVEQLQTGLYRACYFHCTRQEAVRVPLLEALLDAGIQFEQKHHRSCHRVFFCDCSTETYDTFMATIACKRAD